MDRRLFDPNIVGQRFEQTRWVLNLTAIGIGVPCVVLLLAGVPRFGFLPLLETVVPGVIGTLVVTRVRSPRSSQYAQALSGIAFQLAVGLASRHTGGVHSFLLPWAATASLANFGRLKPRIAATSSTIGFVGCIGLVWLQDADGMKDWPWMVLAVTISYVTVLLYGTTMGAAELRHLSESTLDQLTGLLNRRTLASRFVELHDQAMVLGPDTPIAVVMLDLDHFKEINDGMGHAHGDAVLVDVGYLIRKQLRRFEHAYRLGGEEFLILLAGHDEGAAAESAERVRVAIEAERPGGIDVTVSAGVCARPAAEATLEELASSADRALYRAKHEGRNRVVRFSTMPVAAGRGS